MANVVGSSAIVAASKMYTRAVFFLKSEAATNIVIEEGIVIGGLFVQVKPLLSLGTRIVLYNIPPIVSDHAAVPFLE